LRHLLIPIALALTASIAGGCAGAGSTLPLTSRGASSTGVPAGPSASATQPLMVAVGHTVSTARRSSAHIICAGCGPGGDPPPTPDPQPPEQATQDVTFTITVPARTSNPKPRGQARAMRALRPKYISQATQSFSVSMVPETYGTPQTVVGSCLLNADNTSTCNATISPIANQNITFTATLYDGASGAGNQLALGSTTAYLYQGQNNTVVINVDPMVAEVDFFLNDPVTGSPGQSSITLHAGTAATIGGTVVLYDVDGYVVPSNAAAVNYRDPSGNIIAIVPSISYSGGNGGISVTPASFTGQSSGLTLSGSYNGAALSGATISPVIGSESSPCTDPTLPPVCVTPASISFN